MTGKNAVGGLVGTNKGYRHGVVSIFYSDARGAVKGKKNNVGGLVGVNLGNEHGTASISYASAAGGVTGEKRVGGLVGHNRGDKHGIASIVNATAKGAVEGKESVGGLVGYSEGDAIVRDSYFNIDTTKQTSSAGGTGLPTDKMREMLNFQNSAELVSPAENRNFPQATANVKRPRAPDVQNDNDGKRISSQNPSGNSKAQNFVSINGDDKVFTPGSNVLVANAGPGQPAQYRQPNIQPEGPASTPWQNPNTGR